MSFIVSLRRELITSTRRGTVFSERCAPLILLALTVAACVVVWDWRGWDRFSVADAASFARSTFGLICLIPDYVAKSIATDRDRKSRAPRRRVPRTGYRLPPSHASNRTDELRLS